MQVFKYANMKNSHNQSKIDEVANYPIETKVVRVLTQGCVSTRTTLIETVRPNLPKFSHQHPQNSELCRTQQPWDVDQVCCSKAVQVNNFQRFPFFHHFIKKN